jgi:hypothetical protein
VRIKKMRRGYQLLLIGLIIGIAGCILSYEYPQMVRGEIERINAICSFILVVIGGISIVKAESIRTICQKCGVKLVNNETYCSSCGIKI